MKRTGEILKKAREERKLSLHEVALFLKINSRVLQAIEDGDQSQLPARTFLRGFVQSYAKFLKLDPQFVLQVFSEETAPPPPTPIVDSPHVSTLEVKEKPVEVDDIPPLVETKPAPEERTEVDVISLEKSILTQSQDSQDKLGFKTIAVSVLGLFLVVVLYFANNVIKKYQKEAVIDPTDTIASVEDQVGSATDQAEEPTTPVAEATPPEEKKSIPAAPTPPVSAPVASSPIIASPIISPITLPKPVVTAPAPAPAPIPTPPPAPAPTPVAAVTPPTTPATIPPATTATTTEKKPEGKLIEVIVEANDSVEIEYSSAKTSPQKMVLKADQIHTFKSRSGVRLKISNGGAVNIIMNGRDLGAPGAAGQPTQVAY